MKTLLAYAHSFVAGPYRWGGDDPVEGFDCSGLVQEILASVGMDPPGDQTAQGLYDHFKARITTFPKAGALAFFGADWAHITHVAFCLDALRILEAGGGGSTTLTLKDAAKQNAYVRVRTIHRRGDLLGFVMPNYESRPGVTPLTT